MIKRPPRPRPPRVRNSSTARVRRESPQRRLVQDESVAQQPADDVAASEDEASKSAFIPESLADFEDSQSESENNLVKAERWRAVKSTGVKVRGLLSKMRQNTSRTADPEVDQVKQAEPSEDARSRELLISDESFGSGDTPELAPDSVTESKVPARLMRLLGSRIAKANSLSTQSGANTVSLQPLLQEKHKAQRRRIWVTIGAVVISIVVVVAIALSLFVLPVFTLKASGIRVAGVEGEHQQKIVADAQRFVGKPILGTWTSELKSALLKNEWVKDAEISRRFPSSATIKVYPRVPVLAVKRGSTLVAYDDDATELKFADAKQLKLPIVEVKANGEDFKRAIINTSAIMGELPPDLREKVGQYTALSPTNIQFALRSGAVVKWGAREDSKLKVRVLRVLLQVPAKVYDVTSPTAPVTS